MLSLSPHPVLSLDPADELSEEGPRGGSSAYHSLIVGPPPSRVHRSILSLVFSNPWEAILDRSSVLFCLEPGTWPRRRILYACYPVWHAHGVSADPRARSSSLADRWDTGHHAAPALFVRRNVEALSAEPKPPPTSARAVTWLTKWGSTTASAPAQGTGHGQKGQSLLHRYRPRLLWRSGDVLCNSQGRGPGWRKFDLAWCKRAAVA